MFSLLKDAISRALVVIGADPIRQGVIISKQDYAGSSGEGSTVTRMDSTGHEITESTPSVQDSETYELTVKGVDKFGKQVTECIDVDGGTYSTEPIGGEYKP
jgi:hypothetical protein